MRAGDVQPGSLIAGKYRARRQLGAGAMGSVWAACNERTEREVALKLVTADRAASADYRARLLREARAMGRVTHRNVIEVYDVGEMDDGAPFLVMQLLSGESLDHMLARGRLDPAEAARIVADAARGLEAAHRAGIVHRDLKPANVFLHVEGDGEQVTKVIDFGVSKCEIASGPTLSATGIVIGSLAYMSPEQARGAREVDHRSDIWALGVMLFELVTGTLPFGGETFFDSMSQLLTGEIPTLRSRRRDVGLELDRIVARCMEREPSRRYQTALELASALEACLRDGVGRRPAAARGMTTLAAPSERAASQTDPARSSSGVSDAWAPGAWPEAQAPQPSNAPAERAGSPGGSTQGAPGSTRVTTGAPLAASATIELLPEDLTWQRGPRVGRPALLALTGVLVVGGALSFYGLRDREPSAATGPDSAPAAPSVRVDEPIGAVPAGSPGEAADQPAKGDVVDLSSLGEDGKPQRGARAVAPVGRTRRPPATRESGGRPAWPGPVEEPAVSRGPSPTPLVTPASAAPSAGTPGTAPQDPVKQAPGADAETGVESTPRAAATPVPTSPRPSPPPSEEPSRKKPKGRTDAIFEDRN